MRTRFSDDGKFAFAPQSDYEPVGMKNNKGPRHPPSRELWRFCMDRLREIRGADTRERDLANVLGFEHSRAVRWKEGQMYVDRAEYLLRLADRLEVEPMLLVGLAAGNMSPEQARRQVARAGRSSSDDGGKDGSKKSDGSRGSVLLVAANAEGQSDFMEAMGRRSDLAPITATNLVQGISLAERHRPELTFLDLGAANVHAFDACRIVSSLMGSSQNRCRVVAGTATVTDTLEKSALMAGASQVALFPFSRHVYDTELDRLEERLGPRRKKSA